MDSQANWMIMDCDGTLADDSSLPIIGESYWTADNFSKLPFHQSIVKKAISAEKDRLIVLTGRSDAFYGVTDAWLKKTLNRDYYLIMRPAAMHYSEAAKFKLEAVVRIVLDVKPSSLSIYDDDEQVLSHLTAARTKGYRGTFLDVAMKIYECRNGDITEIW